MKRSLIAFKTQLVLFCGLSICFIAGCARDNTPLVPEELVPVTGSITIDGSPTAGVTLFFTPQKDTKGKGGYAVTDASGDFVAIDYSENPGLEPGLYAVTFSRMLMPNGDPLPPGQDAADAEVVESLPEKYTMVKEEHPFMVTVESTGQDIPYELTTK